MASKVLLLNVRRSNGRAYASYVTGEPPKQGQEAKGLQFPQVQNSEVPVNVYDEAKTLPALAEAEFEPRQGKNGLYVVVSAMRLLAGGQATTAAA